jgi:hypothetical protein
MHRLPGGQPRDPEGFHALIARICAAQTAQQHLALIPDLIAFESDTLRPEFQEVWTMHWLRTVNAHTTVSTLR